MRKAAARKLGHELGIPSDYSLDEFTYLTRIHYYAKSDEIWAEHESTSPSLTHSLPFFSSTKLSFQKTCAVDYILFLTLDPSLSINPNEVSATKWVSKQDLEQFFKDPESTFTPWFKLIAESFLYKWWDALMDSREQGEGKVLDAKRLRSVVEREKEVMGGIIRM